MDGYVFHQSQPEHRIYLYEMLGSEKCLDWMNINDLLRLEWRKAGNNEECVGFVREQLSCSKYDGSTVPWTTESYLYVNCVYGMCVSLISMKVLWN